MAIEVAGSLDYFYYSTSVVRQVATEMNPSGCVVLGLSLSGAGGLPGQSASLCQHRFTAGACCSNVKVDSSISFGEKTETDKELSLR